MARLRRMTPAELTLHYPLLQADFPPNELKPLKMLLSSCAQGVCTPWLLEEAGQFRGMALILSPAGCPFVLLDYLAMAEQGRGWGSRCLALLQERYPQGILVEAEADLPGLPEEERLPRRRRLDFYRRAGFLPCAFQARIFGVDYQIHFWASSMPPDRDRACAQALRAIYQAQVPPRMLEQNISLHPFSQEVSP